LGGQLPDTVQLQTEAFGEALPMGCDDTNWGQQTNRRVELWARKAL
jgi:phosphate transport system substrate-binding protein